MGYFYFSLGVSENVVFFIFGFAFKLVFCMFNLNPPQKNVKKYKKDLIFYVG